MTRPRVILLFFMKLVAIYGLLIAPWPGVDRAYVAGFQGVGVFLFGDSGSGRAVSFETETDPARPWKTDVALSSRHNSRSLHFSYDTRTAYAATALALALVLATPIPWSRMRWAIPAALILAHLFLAGRFWLGIVHGFSEQRLGFLQLGPFLRPVVDLGWKIFFLSPESSFYVPILIWIIVAIRLDDLRRLGLLTASPDRKAAPPRPPPDQRNTPRHSTRNSQKP